MEILSAAHAKGLPMAIVSGGTSWHVHQSLEETGIKHYFKAIVTAASHTDGLQTHRACCAQRLLDACQRRLGG
eukprot:366130-Chlamydomonas_euryale.AAC.6